MITKEEQTPTPLALKVEHYTLLSPLNNPEGDSTLGLAVVLLLVFFCYHFFHQISRMTATVPDT